MLQPSTARAWLKLCASAERLVSRVHVFRLPHACGSMSEPLSNGQQTGNELTNYKTLQRDDLALQNLNELMKFANACELPARVRCSLTDVFDVAPAHTPQLADSLTSSVCERASCDWGCEMAEVQQHSKGHCGYASYLSQLFTSSAK